MSLLDKLKPRRDSALLFDALRRAKAERDSTRLAEIPVETPGDAANALASEAVPANEEPAPAGPARALHRGLIALLAVAAILAAAVAWRGFDEPDHASGLKIDSGLDVSRIDSARKAAPPGK